MDAIPCPLCGYDAPARECEHCHLVSREPTLTAPLRGPISGVGSGLRAVPFGFATLLRTSGVKRFLVPPLFLTLVAFSLFFYGAWSFFGELLEAVRVQDASALGLEEGWLRGVVEWLIDTRVLVWMAGLSQVLLFLVTSYLVAAWTFAVVYEALSGPFLDEIQGRLEQRWFGVNPRDAIERPTDLPAGRCALLTTVATVPAAVALVFGFLVSGWIGWAAMAASPVPFLVAAGSNREYGKWLGWVVRVEGRTLWVSVKAASVAGLLLLLFIWLKFVPVIGPPLFFALAGFTTAISLLDIPFSRRQWSLGRRLSFMGRHLLPMTAFGIVAALVFMVPVVGAVAMVPAASIGGQWLVCRLDKDFLRPQSLRLRETAAA